MSPTNEQKIRVGYSSVNGYAELQSTPSIPALRGEPNNRKPSALLRTLIRLAAPHEAINAKLLGSQLTTTHATTLSLRTAFAYVRVPDCRFRENTVDKWSKRAHNFREQRKRASGVYEVRELLRTLTSTDANEILKSTWKELSEHDAVAANVSIVLSLQPKAILLDGRAPDETLEMRILTLAKRLGIAVIWDGCSPITIKSIVSCTTFKAAKSPQKQNRYVKNRYLKNDELASIHSQCEQRSKPTYGTWSTVMIRLIGLIGTVSGAIVGVEASGMKVGSAATTIVHKLTTSNGAVDIAWWRIGTLTLILIGVFSVSLRFKLGVSTRLVVAASRCFVQLGVLGMILVPIIKGNNGVIVVGYLTLMIIIAGLEASNRPPYVYPELFAVCLTSIFLAITMIGTYVFTIVIGTGLEAQYVIPVLGMLMGSSLSGISVGVSSAVTKLVDNTDNIESLLCLGATRWEATQDVVQNAVVIGLTSCLNQMSVTGLVSIPGMMTGQIISGTPPALAARYQLVIMYSVVGSTCTSVMGSILGTIWCVTDNHHRVRVERLVERAKAKKIAELIGQKLASCFRPTRPVISLPSVPGNQPINYGTIQRSESTDAVVSDNK